MVEHKGPEIADLTGEFSDVEVTVHNAGLEVGLDESELVEVAQVAVDKCLSLFY